MITTLAPGLGPISGSATLLWSRTASCPGAATWAGYIPSSSSTRLAGGHCSFTSRVRLRLPSCLWSCTCCRRAGAAQRGPVVRRGYLSSQVERPARWGLVTAPCFWGGLRLDLSARSHSYANDRGRVLWYASSVQSVLDGRSTRSCKCLGLDFDLRMRQAGTWTTSNVG